MSIWCIFRAFFEFKFGYIERVGFPPFFFVAKKFFFSNFLKKCRICFSMKLTVKNFRNFLLLNSLKKNSKIFYSQFHWKKIGIFSENSKKKSFATKKKGSQGGISTIFPGKENPTWPFVGFWREMRLGQSFWCI